MTFTEVCRAEVANFVHSRGRGGSREFWHHRLGHLNVMNVFALQSMLKGMNLRKISCPTSTLVCEICMEGKQYAVKWDNDVERQTTTSLEIVYSSISDPTRNVSVGGAINLLLLLMIFKEDVGSHDEIQRRTV